MTLEQLKNNYIQSISVSTEDKEQLIEEIESTDTLEDFIQVVRSWSQEAVKIGAATVILKRILQEQTKCIVYVIWGQKANDDFAIGKLVKTDNDCDGHAKRYEFDTEIELNAFKKGIEESQGWNEATVVKESEVEIKEIIIVEENDDEKISNSTNTLVHLPITPNNANKDVKILFNKLSTDNNPNINNVINEKDIDNKFVTGKFFSK